MKWDIQEPEDLKRVKERYGETHTIEKVVHKGRIDLRKLKPGESVCAGDGKTYHYKLTKK